MNIFCKFELKLVQKKYFCLIKQTFSFPKIYIFHVFEQKLSSQIKGT